MTSSSEFAPLATPELRSGRLTRVGGTAVLGDQVTERALETLVSEARDAARSQGYAVGWAEGRREAAAEAARAAAARDADEAAARQRWESRQQDALQALTRAAAELARITAATQDAVQAQAVELARELTETLLGHELARSEAAGTTAAQVAARVLAETPDGEPCVLRVHPDVAAALSAEELLGARVTADPGLARHDAVVELDDRVLDLRVSAALERVRAALA